MNLTERKLKTLQEIRLPNEVRFRMREELSSYADLHAIPANVYSPISHTSPFSRLFRLYAGIAAVAFVIAGLGGTAYAAESTLPGDILYPVKTKVAEPLQAALIPSAKGKAAWHAILAERRLEEAAVLAAGDRLSPDAQAKLAINFDHQVEASVSNADALERSGDTAGSLDARSDLEARLTAHEQIFDVVASHLAVATSTEAGQRNDAVKNLLAIVHMQKDAVRGSRIALEHALVPEIPAHPSTVRASTTARVAVATRADESARAEAASAARVESAHAARTMEVEAILTRHATLLAKFLQVATTTTATTTATSTPEIAPNLHQDSSEENVGGN